MEIAAAAAAGMGAPGAARVTELGPPGGFETNAAATAKFEASMERAGFQPAAGAGDVPPGVQGLFKALDNINVQARSVSQYAATAEASGAELTPGEIVQLTMRCQQFMFECQLTSNIANRSSDGVQQLFKQQG